ncbi:uncharacterized protein PV07_10526 [Cladophialophora immunda]|uniref:C2H2-type domain-containing protein n=1 Tax=Cladophialophora immunda TaxID=569365 RepID=A0A0D1ZAV1_9EURO|nr:uncharacterized protein PV07_10526 [Cladophialophora immunda]KIW24836.1 hypothetical protein PV07_10526 [Cladophialophora immunda]
MSLAGVSSATISDLDSYIFDDYQFSFDSSYILQDEAFSFDPPQNHSALNDYQVYSQSNDYPMSKWPEFERVDDLKPSTENQVKLGSCDIDIFNSQVAPPRSNSAASTGSKEDKLSLKPQPSQPLRKPGKGRPRNSEVAITPSKTTTTAGRKRKPTRKSPTTSEVGDSPEEKRKQWLEKNRLTVAKCRNNKKERTENLQRDLREKEDKNACLKEQVMLMKDEIQQMNAILVAHANYEGCKFREETQAQLNALTNDFSTAHQPSFQETILHLPWANSMGYNQELQKKERLMAPDHRENMMADQDGRIEPLTSNTGDNSPCMQKQCAPVHSPQPPALWNQIHPYPFVDQSTHGNQAGMQDITPDFPARVPMMETVAEGASRYRCDHIHPQTGKPCNLGFSQRQNLTRHKRTIHEVDKLRCHLCKNTFGRGDSLLRHTRMVHLDDE